ncbi:TIGR04282 family arsenosugar biosynthesis glycosyltransferase [Limobrevibacterium gyesilva]|uniref:TIGR04282 family arsenosugar biosynthesis glycosyltransferase n=1 Tax=Limobrevibacterium gyesilva TaxID=2991712 RepID=A0AA41YJ30_9PROT|nr:TIGR04282 family arsenosugar biosynthesis glycosyltransferase [Limobrevibacterium gyesilva]
MKDTVFVFARAPHLGTVKRRLARDIGARAALRFYVATLSRTLRLLAADRRFRTVVAVTPDGARGRWLQGLPVVRQGPGDLDQRMQRAFRRHARGRVAIVGSDIPDLRADDVARAFRLLGRAQACFGPAADGGYWLVAMSPRRPAAPFGHVRWSSEWALRDTLANFEGRRVALLRQLRDVDTQADLRAVRNAA